MKYFATLNRVRKVKREKPKQWFYIRAYVGAVEAVIFRCPARSRTDAIAVLKFFQGGHRFHPQMKFTVSKDQPAEFDRWVFR